VADLQDVRNGSAWPALQRTMPDAPVWCETRLDPSNFPLAQPANGTLDAHLMHRWFASPHISDAVFVTALRGRTPRHHHRRAHGRNESAELAGRSGQPEELAIAYTALVNQTAKHSVSIAVHRMTNAAFALLEGSAKRHARGGDGDIGGGVRTYVQPFPVIGDERLVRFSTMFCTSPTGPLRRALPASALVPRTHCIVRRGSC
jgi:hypothetical protein